MRTYLRKVLITYLVGSIGGMLFYIFNLPLAWIIGPVASLIILKSIFHIPTAYSPKLRSMSFVLLGIQIGQTFTTSTFMLVAPYFLPYTLLTFTIIFVGLFLAYVISKRINIDPTTSILGSVPGGLSAIIALSEDINGNTVLITIFHTIRLISVLFIIPFVATHLFYNGGPVTQANSALNSHSSGLLLLTIVIYVCAYFLAKLLNRRVPSAYIIIPMIFIGVLSASGLALVKLPMILVIFAQLTLGTYLGDTVSVKDLKKAGKYSIIYFGLSLFLISMSFGLGYILHLITSMNLPTAILSLAPGGLVEMSLTASSVGGDPSIVSSLQIIRLLFIVLVFPFLLQKALPKLESKGSKE